MPAATDLAPSLTMACGEHGRGGGAVAGEVIGLLRDFAHHLRAHVLELVFELDLLGDGDAVLGDARGAEALVEHDVAALGAERHFHRIGERLDAAQHALARVAGKSYIFGSHFYSSRLISDRQRMRATRAARADAFRRSRP